MIRNFPTSCEGCPNFKILSHFADQCEVLEVATINSQVATVVEVGRVGCRGAPYETASVEGDLLGRVCLADSPIPPKMRQVIVAGAGLSASSELVIQDVPELVGQPQSGALYITPADVRAVEASLHTSEY